MANENTNWKQVAESLREYRDIALADQDFDAAIALCELASSLPPGEAERVLGAVAVEQPGTCAWFSDGEHRSSGTEPCCGCGK